MSRAFTTRRATLHDIDTLVQLRVRLFHETGEIQSDEAPFELVERTRQYLRDHLPTNHFIVWIAEAEAGHIVGMSGLVFFMKPPTEANRSGRTVFCGECRGIRRNRHSGEQCWRIARKRAAQLDR